MLMPGIAVLSVSTDLGHSGSFSTAPKHEKAVLNFLLILEQHKPECKESGELDVGPPSRECACAIRCQAWQLNYSLRVLVGGGGSLGSPPPKPVACYSAT